MRKLIGHTYLREAIKGDHLYGSEDRLSQIFSASFNHSEPFRKAVGDFLGDSRLKQSQCRTQKQYSSRNEDARPDLLFQTAKGRPLVVVENKVDAPFGPNQLKKYNHVKEIERCRKFCFIKHYKVVAELQAGWHLRYWGSFYLHLRRIPECDRITEDFIATLEDYGMDSPLVIEKSDLQRLAKAMHAIRYADRPSLSYNAPIFETMVDLKKLLEDLFRKAAKNPLLRKRSKKAFRPNMKVEHWWYGEKRKGPQWLWVGCDAYLKKPYKTIKGFGAALLLYDQQHRSDKYDLVAYVVDQEDNLVDPVKSYSTKKNVDCAEFAEMAIKYWEKMLK